MGPGYYSKKCGNILLLSVKKIPRVLKKLIACHNSGLGGTGNRKPGKSWNLLSQFPDQRVMKFKSRSWKVMEKQYKAKRYKN